MSGYLGLLLIMLPTYTWGYLTRSVADRINARLGSEIDDQALTDQLRDLIRVANREGMYDAADYLREVVDRAEVRIAEVRP